jgi:hypothetical protein
MMSGVPRTKKFGRTLHCPRHGSALRTFVTLLTTIKWVAGLCFYWRPFQCISVDQFWPVPWRHQLTSHALATQTMACDSWSPHEASIVCCFASFLRLKPILIPPQCPTMLGINLYAWERSLSFLRSPSLDHFSPSLIEVQCADGDSSSFYFCLYLRNTERALEFAISTLTVTIGFSRWVTFMIWSNRLSISFSRKMNMYEERFISGSVANTINLQLICTSRHCKFSPQHPQSCVPPNCKTTCAQ